MHEDDEKELPLLTNKELAALIKALGKVAEATKRERETSTHTEQEPVTQTLNG